MIPSVEKALKRIQAWYSTSIKVLAINPTETASRTRALELQAQINRVAAIT
jgi:hypothetical protein